METLLQTDQPVVAQDNSPSSLSLPEQITPLAVVQDFVAAANSDSIARELSDDCVLSFYGRISRGATVASSYFRLFIASRFQHEGFEEANFVGPAKAEILRVRFTRHFSWMRRRLADQQKGREQATSLHLRAESDDEDGQQQQQQQQLPSRCGAQLVTPPRPSSYDLDEVQFVEANGVLKGFGVVLSPESLDTSTRSSHLILGYRQLPLAFGNKRPISICLAFYEKQSVAMPSVPVPRRGSAARCNPPTDDEAEDDSRTGIGARRALFAEFPNEPKPLGVREQLYEIERQLDQLQQTAEQRQWRLEQQHQTLEQQQQTLEQQQQTLEQQQQAVDQLQQTLDQHKQTREQQQQTLELPQQTLEQPQQTLEQQQQTLEQQQMREEPQQTQEQQQQTLQQTPARAEATTTVEESAEPSTVEKQPSAAPNSSYTPRKRHFDSSGGEMKPKRTPKLNRLRF